MKYILRNDERSKLNVRSKEDKEELFYSLWKEKTPPQTERNELMEEYYERVSYVNEHFDGCKLMGDRPWNDIYFIWTTR